MSRLARRLSRSLAALVVLVSVNVAAPAYADSGGGCKWTNNAQVCISVTSGTTNPLNFDYYIWPTNEYRGVATAQWACGNHYDYSALGPWYGVYGHSAVYSQWKLPGCTAARTIVDFYSFGGVYLYSGYSHWQYW